MLANLVIAKKAAAAEAKARKAKNKTNNTKPSNGGGLPIAKPVDGAALPADETTDPGEEGRGAARGTGGQNEPGALR